MALSTEDEARGMKAYEQARAFERLRSWRLPLTFAAFALVPALVGLWVGVIGHTTVAGFNLALAAFLAWMGRAQWKHLQARHTRNLRLLSELKAEHGDQLPWVQVENHFAALEKLQREMAKPAEGDRS